MSDATARPDKAEYKEGAKTCLAEAVYFETQGTSVRAGQAVANVVLNRRAHEEFPQSVCAVVRDGCQFSYQCDGKPEKMTDPKERERAFHAAELVMEGRSQDPTDGALYFRAESAPDEDWLGLWTAPPRSAEISSTAEAQTLQRLTCTARWRCLKSAEVMLTNGGARGGSRRCRRSR